MDTDTSPENGSGSENNSQKGDQGPELVNESEMKAVETANGNTSPLKARKLNFDEREDLDFKEYFKQANDTRLAVRRRNDEGWSHDGGWYNPDPIIAEYPRRIEGFKRLEYGSILEQNRIQIRLRADKQRYPQPAQNSSWGRLGFGEQERAEMARILTEAKTKGFDKKNFDTTKELEKSVESWPAVSWNHLVGQRQTVLDDYLNSLPDISEEEFLEKRQKFKANEEPQKKERANRRISENYRGEQILPRKALENKRPGYGHESEALHDIVSTTTGAEAREAEKKAREWKMNFYCEPPIQVEKVGETTTRKVNGFFTPRTEEVEPMTTKELEQAWLRHRRFVDSMKGIRAKQPEMDDIREYNLDSKAESLHRLKELIKTHAAFVKYMAKAEERGVMRTKLKNHGPTPEGEFVRNYIAGSVHRLIDGKEVQGLNRLKKNLPESIAPSEEQKNRSTST